MIFYVLIEPCQASALCSTAAIIGWLTTPCISANISILPLFYAVKSNDNIISPPDNEPSSQILACVVKRSPHHCLSPLPFIALEMDVQ